MPIILALAAALAVWFWRSDLLAAAVTMEYTLKPLGINPPLHRRRLDFFRKSFVLSSAKAHRLLNFSPTVSFAAGTVDTATWYRANGYLRS